MPCIVTITVVTELAEIASMCLLLGFRVQKGWLASIISSEPSQSWEVQKSAFVADISSGLQDLARIRRSVMAK
jgi:hypothetical protein